MSVLDQLDASEYFNGEMDEWIEKYSFFEDTFKRGAISVLLIDPNNQMPIRNYSSNYPELDLEYIDFAKCVDGDYKKIANQILNGSYDGYLFDNIDEIGLIEDKEELEYLVKMALKRDTLPFTDSIIDFHERMMIACRCKEMPEYLKGQSLQMMIIEV